LDELTQHTQGFVCGLDIEIERLHFANASISGASLCAADGREIPFPDSSFDLCLCHFLLLWVKEPLLVVQEMRRVTRHKGAVLALAEPDYGGRIDYPDVLAPAGDRQRISLVEQGADPLAGRKLRSIFNKAGLKDIETGVLGAQWSRSPTKEEIDLEWEVLQHDLQDMVNRQEIEIMRSQEIASWDRGERVLFVPTFYAWGRV
jgi:ubiquinone/menaquinone biosynthesis C-methylase UbiE